MAMSVPVVPSKQATFTCSGAARRCNVTENKTASRISGSFNLPCAQRSDMHQVRIRSVPSICCETRHEETVDAFQRMRQVSRTALNTALAASISLALCFGSGVEVAQARFEGVNKPELLPKQFTPVIDVAGFLSGGQAERIVAEVNRIEEDTGFKLRVLAQNYPKTPGLAVKDFWKVDDSTIVFVADPSLGNILNFNVGASVDLSVPRSFWNRLAGKYGNIFYWREKGEDVSIEAAVSAIGACLREPAGAFACSEIQ